MLRIGVSFLLVHDTLQLGDCTLDFVTQHLGSRFLLCRLFLALKPILKVTLFLVLLKILKSLFAFFRDLRLICTLESSTYECEELSSDLSINPLRSTVSSRISSETSPYSFFALDEAIFTDLLMRSRSPRIRFEARTETVAVLQAASKCLERHGYFVLGHFQK